MVSALYGKTLHRDLCFSKCRYPTSASCPSFTPTVGPPLRHSHQLRISSQAAHHLGDMCSKAGCHCGHPDFEALRWNYFQQGRIIPHDEYHLHICKLDELGTWTCIGMCRNMFICMCRLNKYLCMYNLDMNEFILLNLEYIWIPKLQK